jgi:hypothetical protein
MYYTNNEFDQLLKQHGIIAALRHSDTPEQLASYILNMGSSVGYTFTSPMAAAIYNVGADKSDNQVLRILKHASPKALREVLEGRTAMDHLLTPEICAHIVAQLDSAEPDWWYRSLSLSSKVLSSYGRYLIDVVPGQAWRWEGWNNTAATKQVRAYIKDRVKATGCDEALARKLFSEQYDQPNPQRVSLNRFCDILVSLSLAIAK